MEIGFGLVLGLIHLLIFKASYMKLPWDIYIDEPVWDFRNGKYSCANTWDMLRVSFPSVNWWKMVWFPMAIPKHAFILWLAFRNALVTKQKMCCWGYNGNSLCLFCYSAQESIEHLFFKCSFSSRIWRNIMSECSIFLAPLDWDDIPSWGVVVLRGRSLKATLGRLNLGATVYQL
jgi:hypothetical protein